MPWTVPPFLLLTTGCTALTFESEEGQLSLQHFGVTSDEFVDARPGPLLEGTVLCAEVCRVGQHDTWAGCADNAVIDATACFDPGVEGSASLDADGCLVADAPGDAVWRFDAETCTTEDGFVPVDDRVTFDIVATDDVDVSPDFPYDRWLSELIIDDPGVDDGDGWWTTEGDGNPPADSLPGPGEPMRILAGERVTVYVKMRDRAGAPVVRGFGDVSIAGTRGDPPVIQVDEDGHPVDVRRVAARGRRARSQAAGRPANACGVCADASGDSAAHGGTTATTPPPSMST